MSKFKYVDFSRGTAKNNPDMIIREYDRIIKSEKQKLGNFLDNNDYEVNISTSSTGGWYGIEELRHKKKVQVKVNFKEVEALYNQMLHINKQEVDLLNKIKDIEDEKSLFIRKYKH